MFGFNALSQQPFSTQDLELINGVASLVATSSTTASGERLRTSSAAVTGVSALSSGVARVKEGSSAPIGTSVTTVVSAKTTQVGAIVTSASVTSSDVNRARNTSASLTETSSLAAAFVRPRVADPQTITSDSQVTAACVRIKESSSIITGTSLTLAIGREKWEPITNDVDVWTLISNDTNVWTTISNDTNTWTQVA
jgi:hypothetical protein